MERERKTLAVIPNINRGTAIMNTITFNNIAFTTMLDFSSSLTVEDITDRVDELEACQPLESNDQLAELDGLKAILSELEGGGGDHHWDGDWYPQELIHRHEFEERMDDLIADCYPMPDLPSFMRVEINYSDLEMDYATIEIDGSDFLYR